MNKKIDTISPQRLYAVLDKGKKINLIDVRTAAEYRAGHVAGDMMYSYHNRDCSEQVTA
jgi:rhodanese-related sulfurtransferase